MFFWKVSSKNELFEGSKPNRQGKYSKNIYVSCNWKTRSLDDKKPDKIGLFGVNIFFIHLVWLGRRGSNPRMTESKSVALPLGDGPIFCIFKNSAAQRLFLCGFWWPIGDSNSGHLDQKSSALPTELMSQVGWDTGFEPVVSSATNWRVNQLR